jgi:ATP-binding cassette subfamily B multidrug efflux pump
LPKLDLELIMVYFRQNRFSIGTGLVCLIVVDFLQLLIPRVIKSAVDRLTLLSVTPDQLVPDALSIVALAVAIGVFRYAWRWCLLGTSRKIEEGLRNQLFAHIQCLSAEYFDRTRTGDIMAHATNDLQQIRMATGMGLVALNDALVLGTAAIGFMAYIHIRLTLLVMIPMPVIVFGTRFFSRKMHQRYRQVQDSFSDLTEAVRERFTGIRIVKAFNLQADSMTAVQERSSQYVARNLELVKTTGAFFPMMVFLSNVSLAIVLYFGGRQTILADITPGDFVAFISYLGLLTWPMMAMGWVTNLIQRGKASLERIGKIINTRPAVQEPAHPRPVNHFSTAICFSQVGFTYPGAKTAALSSVDFQLKKGQTLGIVGPPGSGKSTLLGLLCRFYDVGSGQINIDGTDIRTLCLRDLRALISVVPQEPFLFSGTIRENILFGAPAASRKELERAVSQAALDQTIAHLPRGYETVVGERGVILSGGQKQRVALARALIAPREVLVFDDPISQVDAATGARIIETLRAQYTRRTVLVVSHRLAAVRFADWMLCMDRGRIVAQGTHDTLMASDTYYRRTAHLQQS